MSDEQAAVEHALAELDGSDFECIREHSKTLRTALSTRPDTQGGGVGCVIYRCTKCGDEYEKDVS